MINTRQAGLRAKHSALPFGRQPGAADRKPRRRSGYVAALGADGSGRRAQRALSIEAAAGIAAASPGGASAAALMR
jgi:hypothetical protein